MSYCRFSSDEFCSDFYVYHSVEGCWVIHLASQRYAQHPLPRYTYPEEHKVYVGDKGGFHLTPEGAQAWLDWQEENRKMVPIELPFAGGNLLLSDAARDARQAPRTGSTGLPSPVLCG